MVTPLHTTDPRVAYMAQGEFFATFDDARSFLADQDKGRGKVRTDYTVIDSAYEKYGRYCVAYAFVTKAGRSLGMIYEAGPVRIAPIFSRPETVNARGETAHDVAMLGSMGGVL